MPLSDTGGELDGPELAIVGVGDLHRHVADHRVRDARLDLLEQPVRVEEPPGIVATGDHEGDGAARHGGAAGQRRLEEAVRGGPELKLPLGEGDGGGDGRVVHHVPRVLTAGEEGLAQLPADGLSAAAARGILGLGADEDVADRCVIVVHRARVARQVEPRPGLPGGRALPELAPGPRAGVLDGLDLDGAERRGRPFERGALLLGRGRAAGEGSQHHQHEGDLAHGLCLRVGPSSDSLPLGLFPTIPSREETMHISRVTLALLVVAAARLRLHHLLPHHRQGHRQVVLHDVLRPAAEQCPVQGSQDPAGRGPARRGHQGSDQGRVRRQHPVIGAHLSGPGA